ncbi:ATP-binding cassette domain-containing protein [Pectobacterium versatile]|uniref:ABC transporter ATP-binding protein n=1 Tax=Pectobacterium versatile TaxID=2488639 RepID=UPI001B39E69D|nr:ABC transporter ATP-binding protein [Pectobacterium versatile]MBQ4782131.1 ATP-binding cassette domain-containing protein [Pectobacterium versatile]MBQ4786559.1 ATP-binding cassette domain-containing protein [Pectobacterium versatile]
MAVIQLRNISKRFEHMQALASLSLDIADGEFLVLVGPSGCGKSTLLRMLAGLEDVSDGQILLGNDDITMWSPKQRNFSMIFQNYALFPHLTVEQNITFGMRMRGEPKADYPQRVQRVASLLQLEPLLKRKPGKLSGGQRQRVAMARAIVRDPRLFLMDEPLSNLDARLRSDVRDGIMDLHRQLKTTTVYVTHDQIEAMTMADRIAVLDRGVLQQVGTPEQLYSHPANVFVAGFIGTPAMNLVTLSCTDGHALLQALPVALPVSEETRSLTSVLLGIRPEHITEHAASDGELSLSGIVKQRELFGAEYLIHVDTPLGNIRYRRPNRDGVPDIGASIVLHFSPQDCHWFSGQTARNLSQEKRNA